MNGFRPPRLKPLPVRAGAELAGHFRVMVVVGPRMFRSALVSVLAAVPGVVAAGMAGAEGVTAEFLQGSRVNLVVVDAGLGVLGRLLEALPEECGAILVSGDGGAPPLPSWRLNRVVGVVSLEAELGDLLAMVRARVGQRSGGAGELSRREAEVYEMVGRGLTSREIGEALGISLQTVQVHLRNAAAKWRISGRELRLRAVAERFAGGQAAGE